MEYNKLLDSIGSKYNDWKHIQTTIDYMSAYRNIKNPQYLVWAFSASIGFVVSLDDDISSKQWLHKNADFFVGERGGEKIEDDELHDIVNDFFKNPHGIIAIKHNIELNKTLNNLD